jgi:RNA polymerase sigma-70 factor (ECF subfamily)
MTDDEILTLTSGPDTREAGFRHLVLKYQQRLYQVVRRQVPTHEDADDILQNTFIKIFRHLARFEGRAGLYTWMYRIAINETNNHHKARERRKEVSLESNDLRVTEPYLNADDLSSVLETMVTKLPERQQMVFRMRYYDELSYKEIAEILQLTEGALKASFHHAVRKIEEELKARQIV